ncbi:MAG: CPBP family intramembrane metalloprotease [Bacteroidetes bacterium]|nr:CPBP family intramembrane metalloprotease [Bacteroidota bacterium]
MLETNAAGPVDTRVQNCDNVFMVGGVYLLSMALLTYGGVSSPVPYVDPSFASRYFWTELGVAALFVAATLFLFDRRTLGLSWPVAGDLKMILPLAVVLLTAAGSWAYSMIALPDGRSVDLEAAFGTLRTTLVVGFGEEWMYRGLLFVFFGRRFGMKKGGFLALLFFGILHLINAAFGVPLVAVAFQFINTMVLGSLFLAAAVGTRSLFVPMIAHGLYDFFVIDSSRVTHLGGPTDGSFVLIGTALVCSVVAIRFMLRFHGVEPYRQVAK